MPRAETNPYIRSQRGTLTGLQVHLAKIADNAWMGDPELQRPRVLSVRTEEEILDYVVRILRIRDHAIREKLKIYLEAEDQLLRLQQGRLPHAMQLRAPLPYRLSPTVRVAEACYGGKYSPHPSVILRQFEQATGWGPAAFEEKLGHGDWLERWQHMKRRETDERKLTDMREAIKGIPAP